MKRINEPAGDTGFPVYQCRLPVSQRTNEYCTDLLSRHLKKIGSRWRALPPGRIVIIVRAVRRWRAAGLGALADLGFLGLTDDSDDPVIVTGYKATRARKLTPARSRPTASWPPHALPSNTASRT